MNRLILSLFILLFSLPSLWAYHIDESHAKNWKEKSVFFGVNKAWDYLPSPKTILSLIARDEGRKFQYNNFDKKFEKTYLKELKEARMLGLKLIGVTDWVPEKLLVERLSSEKVLVKVEGHYLKKQEKVYFTEWQLFENHLYRQLSLTEPESESLRRLPSLEKEQVMKGVLEL